MNYTKEDALKELKKVEEIVSKASEDTDKLNRQTKKSQSIADCVPELYMIRKFIQKEEWLTLFYYYKKELNIKNIQTLLKNKGGSVAHKRIVGLMLNLVKLYNSNN